MAILMHVRGFVKAPLTDSDHTPENSLPLCVFIRGRSNLWAFDHANVVSVFQLTHLMNKKFEWITSLHIIKLLKYFDDFTDGDNG